MTPAATPLSDSAFVRRTLIVVAILSLFALAWMLREVLLMVFGAIVVATLFRSLSGRYQRLRVPKDRRSDWRC
jgi:predicted PurR-regulated permease PerM